MWFLLLFQQSDDRLLGWGWLSQEESWRARSPCSLPTWVAVRSLLLCWSYGRKNTNCAKPGRCPVVPENLEQDTTATSESSHSEVCLILQLPDSQSRNGTWVSLSSHRGRLLCWADFLFPTRLRAQRLNPFQWKMHLVSTPGLWPVLWR